MATLTLLLLLAAGPPHVHGGPPAEGAFEHLERVALERSGGDLDQAAGVAFVHTAEGIEERAITGHDFLRTARLLLSPPGGDAAVRHLVLGEVVTGVTVHDPTLQQRLGIPPCQMNGLFAYHTGPSSAIVHAVTLPMAAHAPVCPLSRAPSLVDSDVSIDLRGVWHVWTSYADATVVVPGVVEPVLGWTVACLTGEAMVYTESWFGIVVDVAWGGTSAWVVGTEAADGVDCA